MTWLLSCFTSSIGRKLVVALTGVALLLFVLVHMLGNLQVFLGPDALNTYAAKLHSLGGLLWVARLGLLAMAALHVGLALKLAAENRAARGTPYVASGRIQSTPGARSMVLTGLMVAAFVLYHLAHFTWHSVHAEFAGKLDALGRPDVYSMVVGSFGQPLIAGLYVVAMLLLGLHLSHGVASVFQSLGWNHPRTEPLQRRLGAGLAALIVVGNCSMPLAVVFGLVSLPGGA